MCDDEHQNIRAVTERIESCLSKGMLCEAQDLARKAQASFPNAIRITQLYALALARLGATEKALAYLTSLYQKQKVDSETAGLLGRVYKDLWKKTGNIDFARQSRDTYLEGFSETRDYYPGINAATMSFILGEKERARDLANAVIEICESSQRDYWSLATSGEAYLIAGDTDKASECYCEAINKARGDHGAVNSSYQQLCLLRSYMAIPEVLFDVLKPPGIVAFTGHMIDHPARPKARFPECLVASVKEELSRVLTRIDAQIGYASAACGADILFIEVMIERGGEINVVLPFREEDFIKTSVGFAGKHWEDRFHRALEKATSVKYLTEEGYFGNDDLFAFAGTIIQGLSILRAESMNTLPTLLALWDRKERERHLGGTADSLTYWPYPDRTTIVDLPSSRSIPLPPQVAVSGKLGEKFTSSVPFGINRTLKCILFADIMGFSKLEEEHTPYFMYQFLRAFAEKLQTFDPQPEVLNTWGDAVFAVYEDARNMVEFAFTLRDMIRQGDWASKDFPSDMDIRIALHAGPVFEGMDPIIGRPNSYGAHINRAARMEPVTVPGCIYASDQFAAKLVVESQDEYSFEYVGILSLPKNFGQQETYHIRRKNEVQ
jgi:class 3 adenylate cyclase/tetratricopeptide (TPR) repeat protein